MPPKPHTEVSELFPRVQQELAHLCALPEIRSAFTWLRAQEPQFAQWQLELARIAAPPFGEDARGEWLAAKFSELGLETVYRDNVGNGFRGPCRARARLCRLERPYGHGLSRGDAAQHPATGQPFVRAWSFGQRGRLDRDAGHRRGLGRGGNSARIAIRVYRQCGRRGRRRPTRHASYFFHAALEGFHPLQLGA